MKALIACCVINNAVQKILIRLAKSTGELSSNMIINLDDKVKYICMAIQFSIQCNTIKTLTPSMIIIPAFITF